MTRPFAPRANFPPMKSLYVFCTASRRLCLGMNSGLRAQQKKKMLNTYSGMKESDKIYVAGHSGLVGNAFVRLLQANGFINLITRSRAAVELRDERAVRDFFGKAGPGVVFGAAVKVGVIEAHMVAPVVFV